MLKRGEVFDGRFKIIRVLARGGMSTVYLAQSVHSSARFAVKEVRTSDDAGAAFLLECLLREIRILKSLEHPSLVRVVDAVRVHDSVLMIMEYVEGKTLEQCMEEDGAFSEEQVLDIACQLSDVLGYLHSRKQRIIYRDLKPANIMIRPDGRCVLIDFGAAIRKRENVRTALGTRGYAAPEQYQAEGRLSEAADIYALGRTMCAMLTGGVPSVKRLKGASFRLRKTVERCVSFRPGQRFAHMAELYYALTHLQEQGLAAKTVQASKLAVFWMFAFPACVFAKRLFVSFDVRTLAACAALILVTVFWWRFADIPGTFLRITGLSRRLGIGRKMLSARVNGVFRIGAHMIAKEALSWQDVEIPLDDPMTDVRIDFDSRRVKFIVMKGFLLERDTMVTLRENYNVIS